MAEAAVNRVPLSEALAVLGELAPEASSEETEVVPLARGSRSAAADADDEPTEIRTPDPAADLRPRRSGGSAQHQSPQDTRGGRP